MQKKLTSAVFTIILILSCNIKSEGLKKQNLHHLINEFLYSHAYYNELDDNLSEKILNNFLYQLDYGKYFFYQKDIDIFSKYKSKIDDFINSKDYAFIFEINDRYKQRFEENMKILNELLKKDFDFKKDDTIIINRDKTDYAKNTTEMQERWRKNIKLQLLNYKAANISIEKAKDKLRKKYSLSQKRINNMTNEDILAKFLNAFSTALDPHSNYLTQEDHEDFKITMELKLEGIGVRLRSEDGFVIVESIIPGGATDKLPESIQLKPEDKIVAVAQKNKEAVDVIDMDLRDVVKLIRGKKGTQVKLTILRKDEDSNKPSRMVVPIVREEIRLEDSDAESEIYINKRNQPIGYIKLPSFYSDPTTNKSSSNDVIRLINQLKKKKIKGLVLDLRGNPGGSLPEAISIAGLFIDHGPILQVKSRGTEPSVYDDEKGILYSGPLVILINKFSASASEILAGAIKDYKRGLILGSNSTFGKGSIQRYSPLPNKMGAIKITTHIFYQPGGTSNQLYGIKPDITIPAITSIWDVGENKTRYPLKWKKIQKADFKTYGKVNTTLLQSLKKSSSKRIKNNKKYQELIVKINKYKTQINNKTISLKDESILEQQKEKELKKKTEKDKNKKTIDLEKDLLLNEAFNITSDYINSIK